MGPEAFIEVIPKSKLTPQWHYVGLTRLPEGVDVAPVRPRFEDRYIAMLRDKAGQADAGLEREQRTDGERPPPARPPEPETPPAY